MTSNHTRKVNPRSVGLVSDETYTKTTTELSLKAEADELVRCAEQSIHTEHVFPVRAVAYNEAENSLTTKLIHGQDLFNSIWNPTSFLGRIKGGGIRNQDVLLSRLQELGEWLAKYHNSESHPDKSEHAAKWLTDSFINKLSFARDNGLISKKIVDLVERKFVAEILNIKKEGYRQENRVRICRVHGDFIVYNMLVDDNDDLHVLDFGDTRISSSIEDVARFYQNIWAISHTSKHRKRLFQEVRDGFLVNNGLPLDIVEAPFFKAVMAYNAVIHLVGGHAMRDLLSLPSRMELAQITNVGLKWMRNEVR